MFFTMPRVVFREAAFSFAADYARARRKENLLRPQGRAVKKANLNFMQLRYCDENVGQRECGRIMHLNFN